MKNLRLLCKSQNTLGEGVCYDAGDDTLYWVDIPEKIFMSLKDGRLARHSLPVMAGFITLARQGGLVIGGNDKLLLWQDGEIRQSKKVGNDGSLTRINDGCPHPSGEFILFGTCHLPETEPLGTAYRLTDAVTPYHQGFTVFNGPAFSLAGDVVYFADSPARIIYSAAVDAATAHIEPPQIFAEIPEELGYPDGMAIDSEGCLWNAHWDGACISRYDPKGTLISRVEVPVQRPTALAFCGDDLKTIVVTSASLGNPPQPSTEPSPPSPDTIQNGDLFAFESNVSGVLVPAYQGNFFS